MPAWRELSLRDLRDVAAHVSRLGPGNAVSPPAAAGDDVTRLFARECASCHGVDGRGDGVAGRVLAPSPTNFHTKRPEASRAEAALAEGVPGSAMPRWQEKLSADERHGLVAYVRSLYEGGR